MKSDVVVDTDTDTWMIVENCACMIMCYVIINCIIRIGEVLLYTNINMLCEYVCCCHACVNYAMVSHNMSTNMLCRVCGLTWCNFACVIHNLCMNFGLAAWSGLVVGSGVSSWFCMMGTVKLCWFNGE